MIMDSLFIVSNLIIALLPFLSLLAAYLYKIIAAKLPEAQRQILEQFVQFGVQMAEQVGGSGAQKKAIALQAIDQLFHTFNMPVPDDAAVDTMIESAVFLVNQMVHTSTAKNTYTQTSIPAVRPNQ
jgi:Bacteriophage holin of superfamily 6 (Holin_LLH)